MSLTQFWAEHLEEISFSRALTPYGNNNAEAQNTNATVIRDGYEWATTDGANEDRQEYYTAGLMSQPVRDSIEAIGDKILIVDVRRASGGVATVPQIRLNNYTLGTGASPSFDLSAGEFQSWTITDPDLTVVGSADVSGLYDLPAGTVYRLWMGLHADGTDPANLSFLFNYGRLECDFRNFAIFDRSVFSSSDAIMARQIELMDPHVTFLGAQGITGNPGTFSFTAFEDAVGGNRVAIMIVDVPASNTFSNVLIGGAAATWRATEDQNNGHVHLYDAVVPTSGPLTVQMDIAGIYSDNIVAAYDVGNRTYARSRDAYLHTAAPSTFDISMNTAQDELLLLGVKHNGTSQPWVGAPEFDADGYLRAVGYVFGHRLAKGGTPETVQMHYPTNWIAFFGVLAAYEPAGEAGQTITGAAFDDSADTFGAGAVAVGPVAITGVSFADPDAFGAGAVAAGPIQISGLAHLDADAFGAGAVVPGPIQISGVGHLDTDGFGAGIVSAGSVIGGAAHSDPDAFGSGLVAVGAVSIEGSVLVDADAFGAGSVGIAGGPQGIGGAAHSDPDAFGAGAVVPGPIQISGAGHDDADAFGAGEVRLVIRGTVYVDADAFGSGQITAGDVVIVGTAFADPDAFGDGLVTDQPLSSRRWEAPGWSGSAGIVSAVGGARSAGVVSGYRS